LVRAVQFHVVGHVLVERNRERAPVQHPGEGELWSAGAAGNDTALARALAGPVDMERLFVTSARALVKSLLAPSDAPPERPTATPADRPTAAADDRPTAAPPEKPTDAVSERPTVTQPEQ